MGRLHYLKTLREPVYTKLSMVKDSDRSGYFVEKSLIVNIDFQKRLFENEMAIHQKLAHRYIIKFIEQVGEFCFLMEYASYGNLQRVIDSNMDEKERLHLSLNALKGLEYLHSLGYAHNDIKPSNILVTGEHRAKLSDFAFCGLIDTITFDDIPSYFYMGTEFFRPPGEKFSYVNHLSNDIYAMGKVLYLLFSSLKMPRFVELDAIPNPKLREIVNNCLDGSYCSVEPIIQALNSLS